ncbi:hypothetical protein CONLIGDRAFT_686704 [Coniochaeta ligniaria NRRL 30616]|uniref:Uncharacterized protein n=1 Tax=Coniochaeta ligniaria NRRL 30616 TaxID=1408157 RepID=A0A1J7J6Y9_9PEZI|nr:hypothetical protein CONLIGDRAFT_686704 [Coniochaeta ligniaria NRRL 30616]
MPSNALESNGSSTTIQHYPKPKADPSPSLTITTNSTTPSAASTCPRHTVATVWDTTSLTVPPSVRPGPQHHPTGYTLLQCRPISVITETEADRASEEGRSQLAAWQQLIGHKLEKRCGRHAGDEDNDLVWRDRTAGSSAFRCFSSLSSVAAWCCRLSVTELRGDRLKAVGDVPLAGTRRLSALYFLVVTVLEVGDWIEGPFWSWSGDLLS